MEELGIGRPSTYTAILKTLEDREYVGHRQAQADPAFARPAALGVPGKLLREICRVRLHRRRWRRSSTRFPTASWCEATFCAISGSDFSAAVAEIKDLRVGDVLETLNEELAPLIFPAREDGSNPRICPKCGVGNALAQARKIRRTSSAARTIRNAALPASSATPPMARARTAQGEDNGTKVLGKDPYTNEEITLRSGRFGPYLQRGDGKEAKRSSLPKGWTPDSIDHEKALALLALPRDVGKHPESGKMISAGLGRYGPFVLHDGTYANLESIEDVFSIGLNRAVSVIADKQSEGPWRAERRHRRRR